MQNVMMISNPLKFFCLKASKKVKSKTSLKKRVKVKKVHNSVTFLIITFFGAFKKKFFTESFFKGIVQPFELGARLDSFDPL
jgi:hypothetical protein